VRPDRILPPITKSAAVTASLEADELAVAMDHLRVSAELLELKQLASAFLAPRAIPLKTHPAGGPLASCNTFHGPRGWKKISSAEMRARRRPSCAINEHIYSF
jgi:hypothetical protein